jgi:hypothetical protein
VSYNKDSVRIFPPMPGPSLSLLKNPFVRTWHIDFFSSFEFQLSIENNNPNVGTLGHILVAEEFLPDSVLSCYPHPQLQ